MFRLIWAASIRVHDLLRWAPTNLLLDRIRTRRGLKWGIPAMFLAAPLLIAAATCTAGILNGAPGWLNLLVVLFIWDALKFHVMGPVSLGLLAGVRVRETKDRRQGDQRRHDLVVHEAVGAVPATGQRDG
jgi:hypothetical protein